MKKSADRLPSLRMNSDDDLSYVVDLSHEAAALVLAQYGKVERLIKRHAEAVSEADRASQRLIVAGLRRRFPDDGIVGEENETGDAITFDSSNPSGRNWVIDPIDGTNNFLAGLGAFAVCIGLLEGGVPTLGVVHDVTRQQTYSAASGQGAWLGKKQLRVLQTPMGDNAMLMLTSNLIDFEGRCPSFVSRWMGQTNWKIRILGSAAMEVMQVAAGVAHGAITLNGKLWDIVAPAAIALEAGAVVTTTRGESIFPFNLNNYAGARVPFLCAAPVAHGELVRELSC
ncbi:MAG: inositol monophosphatase [Planctomycetota bacterium]|nr:inositol monophosphatase [Planctomycetota bacterium]